MSEIFLAKDTNNAKHLANQVKLGNMRRIYRGVYTDNVVDPLPKIVYTYWPNIVSHIVKGGIFSYRTAIDFKPTPFEQENIVFITSSYAKTIHLPGLIVKIIKGNNISYIEEPLPGVLRSNLARRLLENLTVVRGKKWQGIKTCGPEGIENFLAKELMLKGEQAINHIRDEAKSVADELNYQKEFTKLNSIISALLSTQDDSVLRSNYAQSVARKKPYDVARITLFEQLAVYIKQCIFIARDYQYSEQSFRNLAFFESYFSNYIEGTEFIIDEAEDIVFKGREIQNRHADSHDVLSVFKLCNDYYEMNITPQSENQLLEILQNRHANIMQARPDKNPGEFKTKPNKAGNTYFVMPDEVIGTLCRGFEIYQLLTSGFEKALFMHLLISEIHPFTDGNGRLARIMMNAELVSANICKIIIPTVHRDNYLNGLRIASRDADFRSYCKSLDQAQAYTHSVNWFDYLDARSKIEHDDANLTGDEGLPTFYRALRQLDLSDISN